ncbi:Aste57867_18512 [Aphanomyces stellatus]|uniref:Aste57867_18512 protein n=1 Tax=Aphanomyces stellatus TaxID=120398 RepID=A0A485LBX5_9STRA|nr:hypothetical protein As57867_018450 [Aphanomyces stellatus]VFT95248.1 Aste57867_18512 [Aphanomyces stellatus]
MKPADCKNQQHLSGHPKKRTKHESPPASPSPATFAKTFESMQMLMKMAQWKELECLVQSNLAYIPNVVTLDVGWMPFRTTKATLLRVEDTYFTTLLGSGHWKLDVHGSYFLDLDPAYFHRSHHGSILEPHWTS